MCRMALRLVKTDNMILDIQNGTSASGFGHPSCKGGKPPDEIIKQLPEQFKTKAGNQSPAIHGRAVDAQLPHTEAANTIQ